jgi:hypothetical protein
LKIWTSLNISFIVLERWRHFVQVSTPNMAIKESSSSPSTSISGDTKIKGVLTHGGINDWMVVYPVFWISLLGGCMNLEVTYITGH